MRDDSSRPFLVGDGGVLVERVQDYEDYANILDMYKYVPEEVRLYDDSRRLTTLEDVYKDLWYMSLADNLVRGNTKEVKDVKVDESSSSHAHNLLDMADDQPIITNADGGKQSSGLGDYTLLPPLAVQAVAANLEYGATRYAPWNWLKIPTNDHVNHALAHTIAFNSGDVTDGKLSRYSPLVTHLISAATRLLFALDVELRKELK